MAMIDNSHFVCLKCRRSIKVRRGDDATCAICRCAMISLWKQFTTPSKKDAAAWRKLEWMISNGWRGHGWPTQPKMTLLEVQESLAAEQRKAEKTAQYWNQSAVLEERRRAAKHKILCSKVGKREREAESKRQEEYQKAVLDSLSTKENRAA